MEKRKKLNSPPPNSLSYDLWAEQMIRWPCYMGGPFFPEYCLNMDTRDIKHLDCQKCRDETKIKKFSED